jgi:antitoxin CptB
MDAARINRARARAWRRGFREADLIFGPFADNHARDFSEDEMTAFEALLEAPDLDVVDWILGGRPTPSQYETPLMERLRVFARTFNERRTGG